VNIFYFNLVLMSMCFVKYSSIINLIYSGLELFSYLYVTCICASVCLSF
jgi:hypothetical protein